MTSGSLILVPCLCQDRRVPDPGGSPCSLPFPASVTALRLRARKDRVGVISRSTMLLSHGLSCKLRSGEGEGPLVHHKPQSCSHSRRWEGAAVCLQQTTAHAQFQECPELGCAGEGPHSPARLSRMKGNAGPGMGGRLRACGRRCGMMSGVLVSCGHCSHHVTSGARCHPGDSSLWPLLVPSSGTLLCPYPV